MVFDRNDTLVGMERLRVVAEFENQAHTAGLEYGYDPKKLERFIAVRGKIAETAISVFGVTDVEGITPEIVEEIAMMASPKLQEKISKNDEERRHYKRLAQIDELTGLGSRHAFKAALATAEASPDVSFVKFDANNFGKINKELGDDVGDTALRGIGRHLRDVAEEYGYGERAFRVGGDEFVVLTSSEIADELLAKSTATYGEDGTGSQQYGSTTVSLTGAVGSTLEEVNLALRDAKEEHRQNR